MVVLLRKYWFFFGIAGVLTLAFTVPAVGETLHRFDVVRIGVFVAFLITGLTLETSAMLQALRNVTGLVAALISSLVLFPVVAFVLARLFLGPWEDLVIGTLIVAVAPVTIASGTVMTGIARGNVPFSLFICVTGNAVAIFSVPASLALVMEQTGGVDLPVLRMLGSLVLTVLVPIVLGQALRPLVKGRIAPYRKAFSVFSQCIVLLIILNAVTSSTDRLAEGGHILLAVVFAFTIGLHGLMLALNWGVARLVRLDAASTTAFAIHVSQKTLTISFVVWAGYFAADYPMALIPSIAYHLTQMVMGTLVAEQIRRRVDAGGR